MTTKQINEKLEYMRQQIENECMSYGDVVELQDLADIPAARSEMDVRLLEWAGVPEFPDSS